MEEDKGRWLEVLDDLLRVSGVCAGLFFRDVEVAEEDLGDGEEGRVVALDVERAVAPGVGALDVDALLLAVLADVAEVLLLPARRDEVRCGSDARPAPGHTGRFSS